MSLFRLARSLRGEADLSLGHALTLPNRHLPQWLWTAQDACLNMLPSRSHAFWRMQFAGTQSAKRALEIAGNALWTARNSQKCY